MFLYVINIVLSKGGLSLFSRLSEVQNKLYDVKKTILSLEGNLIDLIAHPELINTNPGENNNDPNLYNISYPMDIKDDLSEAWSIKRTLNGSEYYIIQEILEQEKYSLES